MSVVIILFRCIYPRHFEEGSERKHLTGPWCKKRLWTTGIRGYLAKCKGTGHEGSGGLVVKDVDSGPEGFRFESISCEVHFFLIYSIYLYQSK